MGDISVHHATIFDLDALVPLFDQYRQFHGCGADARAAREFLRQRLNHGESVLFLASKNNQPIGFAQLYPTFSSISLARTFVMNDLFVLEKFRRCGAALRLMTAAVDYASALHAEKISLSIDHTNVSAQSLYGSTGWELDDQSKTYYFQVPELLEMAA